MELYTAANVTDIGNAQLSFPNEEDIRLISAMKEAEVNCGSCMTKLLQKILW